MLLTQKNHWVYSGIVSREMVLNNTVEQADTFAPDSRDFFTSKVLLNGRDGLVRKANRLACSRLLTSHPPYTLNNVCGGLKTSARSKTMTALSICNTPIRQFDGLFNLNDLHVASGGEQKHRPNQFVRLDQTKALIDEINRCADMRIINSAVKTIRGKGKEQGTYACKEIVYAYAMWISPAFMLQVIRTYDALVAPKAITSDTISLAQQQQLKEAVNSRVFVTNSTHQAIWRQLYNAFNVPRYQELPASQFEAAMKFLGKSPKPQLTSSPVSMLSGFRLPIEDSTWMVNIENGYISSAKMISRGAASIAGVIFNSNQKTYGEAGRI